MASADWLGEGLQQLGQCPPRSRPALRRRTTRAPTISASCCIGTASTERHPASFEPREVRVEGRRRRGPAPCCGSPSRQARPTSVLSREMWVGAEPSSSSAAGAVCRPDPELAALAASSSSSEPPSVPVSCTACVTIVVSTSSRSRLELTAWPISRRASSCPTLSASSVVRACSVTHQVDVADRDRGLGGERADQLDRPFAERVDLAAPQRQHADDLVLDAAWARRERSGTRPTRWTSGRPYSGSASTSAICCARRSRATRPVSVARSATNGCSRDVVAGSRRRLRSRRRPGSVPSSRR